MKEKTNSTLSNLKRNWYFPISAAVFFCLNVNSLEYLIGLLPAFIAALFMASRISSMWRFVREKTVGFQIISIVTTIGICHAGGEFFYSVISTSSSFQNLIYRFPFPFNSFWCIRAAVVILAIPFVYICLMLFWYVLSGIVVKTGMFKDINLAEVFFYIILLVIVLIFVTVVFMRTNAFYGPDIHSYNIIYTADSGWFVEGSGYLLLTHPENDIRSPLFAVFSAPFIGIPYLVGQLFRLSTAMQAVLMNYVQVIMIFFANYLIAKMMKLASYKRACFMLLTCFTYMQLLFVLMMEQYIIAYWWLIFCLYMLCESNQESRLPLWGAGGTLLTSMVLLPFISRKNPLKDFKGWVWDMVKAGLEFIALILAFCRLDVIINLIKNIRSLIGYAGKSLTWTQKVYQYTEYIHNCLFASNAGVNYKNAAYISWQLNEAAEVNVTGVLIMILAVVSAILNRDKKVSLLAVYWGGFSVVMLLILGYGTQENGLILYSLYFGWIFLMLLFQLVEKLEGMLRVRFLLPIISIGACIVLAVINIPAIAEMVKFAVSYFPT